MWPTLIEAITTHLRMNRPEAAFASEEILNMDHEEAIQNISQSGNFNREYEATEREALHGAIPFLINSVQFHLQKESLLWIQFHNVNGGTIDLKLNNELIHGFCKLLIDAETKTDWQLDLRMPKAEDLNRPAHLLN